MRSTKKERMYQKIKKHGEELNAIFNTGIEPIALCKKLHRLEGKAHRLAENYCNGDNGITSDNWESKVYPILKQVNKILKVNGMNDYIFVDGDARGYALKIEPDFLISKKLYRDFGDYGILAPEFNGEK